MNESLKQYGIWAAIILVILLVAGISWQAGSQAGYAGGFVDGMDSAEDVYNSAISTKCKNCLFKCNYAENRFECLSDCDLIC
ncbi:hypothetical protein [Methanocalculus sp.]|uniref:hypothetical protein n=1 Tax=Methanocalculus sp. TaxID=2004547 RepID=UPI0026131A9F|nr:hypothetical protein [Methanocalculus sp.]MDG6250005.1 hypothetical protein [Methanocalculus sp.]